MNDSHVIYPSQYGVNPTYVVYPRFGNENCKYALLTYHHGSRVETVHLFVEDIRMILLCQLFFTSYRPRILQATSTNIEGQLHLSILLENGKRMFHLRGAISAA